MGIIITVICYVNTVYQYLIVAPRIVYVLRLENTILIGYVLNVTLLGFKEIIVLVIVTNTCYSGSIVKVGVNIITNLFGKNLSSVYKVTM